MFDFTSSRERTCVEFRRSGMTVAGSLPRYRKLLERHLPVRNGRTIQEILRPLLKQLAISAEGHGSLSVVIKKNAGTVRGSNLGATATITAYGLADDSISGVDYVISFAVKDEGWEAVGLRRKQMCARGAKAGQWTTGSCG